MAIRKRYIRLDSTSGGDGTEDVTTGSTRAYESLSAAISGEAADLVAAGDSLEIEITTGGVDSGLKNINGFTVDASNTITIEATGLAFHNGVSRENGGTGYQALHIGETLNIDEEYVTIRGFEVSTSGQNFRAMDLSGDAAGEIVVEQMLVNSTNANISSTEILRCEGSANLTIRNCLILANGHRGIRSLEGSGTTTIDHCGIAAGGSFGVLPNNSDTITNSWAISATSEDFYTGSSAPSGSNNASEDGTAGTDFTSGVINITPSNEFTSPSVDPSIADFTLLDSNLNGAGTGSESVDITGATRTGTADIGPFNFSAGSASLPGSPVGRKSLLRGLVG